MGPRAPRVTQSQGQSSAEATPPPHRPDHSRVTQMLPLWSEEGQHWPLGPQVPTPPCVPHPGPGCRELPQGGALECVSLEPPWTLVP